MPRNPIFTVVATSLLVLFCLSQSIAQTEVPHTFQAGQPARATEVNENFDVLEDAISVNTEDIAGNEAAIQKNAEAIAELASGEAIVLDFTDPNACVIDESGRYFLDRKWSAGGPDGNLACRASYEAIIEITASGVFLDLNNFGISKNSDYMSHETDVIHVTGTGYVSIQNGFLGSSFAYSISAPVARVRLENVKTTSVYLGGTNSYIGNSTINASEQTAALSISGRQITVEGSTISGKSTVSIGGRGPGIVLRNNWLVGDVDIEGDDTSIMNNTIDGRIFVGGDNAFVVLNTGTGGFRIGGDNGVLRSNTTDCNQWSDYITRGIIVTGTSNVVDANLVRGCDEGIKINGSGNYYGDNRVSATIPYVGTEGQTDWGGNVSF